MTSLIRPQIIEEAMRLAIREAEKFAGATNPNPPVGAAGLDAEGNILALAAHERAGQPHAERNLIQIFQDMGELEELHTLVVTLEPCNHQGKTPPCTTGILGTNIKQVFIGTLDTNPHVAGKGIETLRSAGIHVEVGILESECRYQLRSFFHKAKTGLPWVTVKQAIRKNGSMEPSKGRKTFTSPEGLVLAHRLRRRADAIITGSGTVLSDNPLFTVRHIPDFAEKSRFVVALDRRNRIDPAWISSIEAAGFTFLAASSFEEALVELGRAGAMEILVEAGPKLCNFVLEHQLWDEHVLIQEGINADSRFILRDPVSVIGRESQKGSYCLPGLFKPCAPFVG